MILFCCYFNIIVLYLKHTNKEILKHNIMKLIIKTIACTLTVLFTCYIVYLFFAVPSALKESEELHKQYLESVERTSKPAPKTMEQVIYENNKAKEQYIFKPKKDTAL